MTGGDDERVPPGPDLERYVRELAEFVGLDEADAVAIRASAPAILKHEAALTTALYEHFLRFPATARFFLGPDGAPDRARIDRRKH
ncbi:MAG: protoglobin domain-containing protein, partial [Candidatus Rokuibacteriota bacterium]